MSGGYEELSAGFGNRFGAQHNDYIQFLKRHGKKGLTQGQLLDQYDAFQRNRRHCDHRVLENSPAQGLMWHCDDWVKGKKPKNTSRPNAWIKAVKKEALASHRTYPEVLNDPSFRLRYKRMEGTEPVSYTPYKGKQKVHKGGPIPLDFNRGIMLDDLAAPQLDDIGEPMRVYDDSRRGLNFDIPESIRSQQRYYHPQDEEGFLDLGESMKMHQRDEGRVEELQEFERSGRNPNLHMILPKPKDADLDALRIKINAMYPDGLDLDEEEQVIIRGMMPKVMTEDAVQRISIMSDKEIIDRARTIHHQLAKFNDDLAATDVPSDIAKIMKWKMDLMNDPFSRMVVQRANTMMKDPHAIEAAFEDEGVERYFYKFDVLLRARAMKLTTDAKLYLLSNVIYPVEHIDRGSEKWAFIYKQLGIKSRSFAAEALASNIIQDATEIAEQGDQSFINVADVQRAIRQEPTIKRIVQMLDEDLTGSGRRRRY